MDKPSEFVEEAGRWQRFLKGGGWPVFAVLLIVVVIVQSAGLAYLTFGKDIAARVSLAQFNAEKASAASRWSSHMDTEEKAQTEAIMQQVQEVAERIRADFARELSARDQVLVEHRSSGHQKTREELVQVATEVRALKEQTKQQLDRIERKLDSQ